jgi:hypothetical protein
MFLFAYFPYVKKIRRLMIPPSYLYVFKFPSHSNFLKYGHIFMKIGTYVMAPDCLCGLVVRVPGCRKEVYCVSCEVRTEFLYVM